MSLSSNFFFLNMSLQTAGARPSTKMPFLPQGPMTSYPYRGRFTSCLALAGFSCCPSHMPGHNPCALELLIDLQPPQQTEPFYTLCLELVHVAENSTWLAGSRRGDSGLVDLFPNWERHPLPADQACPRKELAGALRPGVSPGKVLIPRPEAQLTEVGPAPRAEGASQGHPA